MRSARRGPQTVDEYSEWNAGLLARSPVSRRDVLKAVTAGAGGIVLAQFARADRAMAAGGGRPGSAGVAVSGRHLSFATGPGTSPCTAMAVTAQLVSRTGSLPRSLRAWVELGTAAGGYGRRVPADIVHLVGQYAIPGGPVGSQFYVKATMDDLHPDTSYRYRVALSDGTVSGDACFTTAPLVVGGRHRSTSRPFTFTAFADVGTNAAPTDPQYAWNADPQSVRDAGGTWPAGVFDDDYYSATDPVAGPNGTDPAPAATQTRLMGSQRPVFTLLAGDICYADPGGTGLPADDTLALSPTQPTAPPGTNAYDPYVWDVFFDQIESQAAFTPWMFATGNHDMEPLYGNTTFLGDSPTHGYGGHLARLDLPTNGPRSCPSVYSFTYGNVGVISVDANDLSAEIQTNLGYSGGAQAVWLEQTLQAWRTDPLLAPTIDFVVVFLHHCAYSTTNQHASDGGVRAVLDPLASRYQVDLVVQGHNHVMERSDPIKHGRKTTSAPDGATICPATDGVTYLTIGSGGRPRYQFRPAPGTDAPPPPGVTPEGVQLLPEGQRYRGYIPAATQNGTEVVDNSYLWSAEGTALTSSGYPAGTRVPEAIDWSQVRYDDYAFIAVDVSPAEIGRTTTFTIRTLADALPGSGHEFTEIDRVTLTRTAGKGLVPSGVQPSAFVLPGQPAFAGTGISR